MGALLPDMAQAGVARGLPLEQLVRRSAHILRGRPLDAYSEWTRYGDQRRIVTYTRVRVDEALVGGGEAELLVRTLGGTVGKLGQVVHGEADLLLNEDCVAFLMPDRDGMLGVTAMAQGHYPLASDSSGVVRLNPSRQLSVLLDDKTSAVARLRGRSVLEARELVKQAAKQ
ncbi:MAG TPA: hypothetical protein VM686_15040 [Polyangiaceae bacterium]|nr:hypothetical protein [Polyangiaceae bacterium]